MDVNKLDTNITDCLRGVAPTPVDKLYTCLFDRGLKDRLLISFRLHALKEQGLIRYDGHNQTYELVA